MSKRGYAVTVSGQYYSGSGRDKMLKVFSNEKFYIPEVVEIVNGQKYIFMKDPSDPSGKRQLKKAVPNKQTVNGLKAALHVIRRRLIDARLAEKYQDYTNVRTCFIVDQKPCLIPDSEIVDIKKPILEMSLTELNMLCASESLMTVPKMFASLDDARQAVSGEMKQKTGVSRNTLTVGNTLTVVPTFEEESYVQPETTGVSEPETAGVSESSGEVTSEDGVPVDEEDPAASLI